MERPDPSLRRVLEVLRKDSRKRFSAANRPLKGGGSHIVQQLAHIGFKRYVLYDDAVVEELNLNRLVGAQARDARPQTPKLHIVKMMILDLQPDAIISGYASK